ncbi:MAG: hypothetical protein P8N76_01120 [Pirellulaceae bacterium]|nr:hypothetical protein [Pirellulaceae bacterium]
MFSRLIKFLLGVSYLLLIDRLFAEATRSSFWLVLPIVTGLAAINAACSSFFAIKLVNRKQTIRQFDLSALLLLIVPLAIYLATVQRLL